MYELYHDVLITVLLLPLFAAGFAATAPAPNVREVVTLLCGILTCLGGVILLGSVLSGYLVFAYFVEIIPGLALAFSLEPLGMVFLLVLSFLWTVSTLYCIGYMRANKEEHQDRFYSYFALSIFAAIGVATADNLFTLFVFYEMLTLVTYPLVTHHGDKESKDAGRVYLGMLLGSSLVFFLPAVIMTWYYAGTLNFTPGGILQGKIQPAYAVLLLLFYLYGIGKAAVMPMHRWLPAAMVAPAPVSALLHAVAVVKAGVFSIVKILLYIFGTDFLSGLIPQDGWYGSWLVGIAAITVVVASVVALQQNNLKKRLAYSTISQLSYVLMAVAMLSPKAIVAAVFHIVAHAFGKITLFFAAGAIYTVTGKTKVSELAGLGRRMPFTMAAFAVGALTVIGVPFTAGFISKWGMLAGAFDSERFVVIIVIIISTLLNIFYLLPIVYSAFFEKERRGQKPGLEEAPLPAVIALVITAFVAVLLFFVPDVFLALANRLVE